MNDRSGHALRFAQPLRTLAQRSAFLLLLASAVGLMLWGKTDPQIFDRARAAVTDAAAPILDVISRPMTAAESVVQEGRDLIAIRAENERLRLENERLLQWRAVARTLQHENAQLRDLLNFQRDDAQRYITGRVIGFGGSFVRALLLNVGDDRGVRKGQAAVSGDGLIGRVAEVGERSSRVLLITDLNSRIPVVIEETRVRAILAGDNTQRPRLIYLSANSDLEVGQRVVTSGHGGAFPPGVPVGRVVAVGETGVRVAPFADPDRLEFVELMDFGLGGILEDGPVEIEAAAAAERAAARAAEAAREQEAARRQTIDPSLQTRPTVPAPPASAPEASAPAPTATGG
ncbi:MAG: rod shape-determining protein MreC [Marivibrio sp.]|uniref:rod shape-determining protein MreC n=1 Tax=Marivibrio sp. TaxID=2039719 RepID=UPI0032EAE895